MDKVEISRLRNAKRGEGAVENRVARYSIACAYRWIGSMDGWLLVGANPCVTPLEGYKQVCANLDSD